MRLTINVEFELTKEKVYDENNEVREEYTFVVDAEWLSKLYYEHITKIFDYEDYTLDEFLDMYDCDIEGVAIYYIAKGQNKIKEEGWSEVADDLY